MTNLFYMRSPNFGDALNVVLHKAITQQEPTWTDPDRQGTILAIGSLAHCAKPGNVLWGTGAMSDDLELQCDHTTQALAVRGPLTAWLLQKKGVDVSATVFGDPACLLPLYFPTPAALPDDFRGYDLVIPHYTDVQRAMGCTWREGTKVVSPMTDARKLIDLIANAFVVISSSLHAIIVAEAYEVPAVWVEFSDDVHGKGFKFIDYYLGSHYSYPTAVQIRGTQVPEEKISERILEWKPPIEKGRVREQLLNYCPFTL